MVLKGPSRGSVRQENLLEVISKDVGGRSGKSVQTDLLSLAPSSSRLSAMM
jgi:hypothetical protein